MTTQNQNPAVVKRMLTQLAPLVGASKPTSAICLATQREIDAEEQLMHMINQHKTNPTRTTPTTPQTASERRRTNDWAQSSRVSTTSQPHSV